MAARPVRYSVPHGSLPGCEPAAAAQRSAARSWVGVVVGSRPANRSGRWAADHRAARSGSGTSRSGRPAPIA
eukprot:scaffold3901_cov390-Prasinococcus_capsulatus_cf.AAC.1